jgi:hypothetical protein
MLEKMETVSLLMIYALIFFALFRGFWYQNRGYGIFVMVFAFVLAILETILVFFSRAPAWIVLILFAYLAVCALILPPKITEAGEEKGGEEK